MNRLFGAAGVDSDSALARVLGIQPPSVAGARKRGLIPGGWIEKIALDYNVTADWLLFGRGPMHPSESTEQSPPPVYPAVPPAPEPVPQVTCPRCARLEAKLEKVEEQRDDLAQENRQLLRENGDLKARVAQLEAEVHKPPELGGRYPQTGQIA